MALGDDIKGVADGILSPVGGFLTGLLGTTKVTETTGAKDTGNSRTGLYIIAGLGLAVIVTVVIVLISKSKPT